MPNVASYLIIADNNGIVIPNLDIALKDLTDTYNCNYLNGRYNYSCPSGIYDVYDETQGIKIIENFYVVPQLIKREWWIEAKTLTDGGIYIFSALQDNFSEYLPASITDPKISIANNIGTRSVSFYDITSSEFKVKLGDSGTPATVTADLHIKELTA